MVFAHDPILCSTELASDRRARILLILSSGTPFSLYGSLKIANVIRVVFFTFDPTDYIPLLSDRLETLSNTLFKPTSLARDHFYVGSRSVQNR